MSFYSPFYMIYELETMKKLFLSILALLCMFSMTAQTDSLAYSTPEKLADAMLAFITCEKDEVKDWDEYRNLFLPEANKLSFRPNPGQPLSRQVRSSNLEEFVRYSSPSYAKNGFEEYTIGVKVNEFNGIASVFQSFYCKSGDGSYEARGVNSYQMVFLNNRWWIANTMFINETDDVKLPDELLFEKYRSNSTKD